MFYQILYQLSRQIFQWWCRNRNTLWSRCFITSTILSPHLFLLGWLVALWETELGSSGPRGFSISRLKYWRSFSAISHMKVCPYSYFRWCGYFRSPWVSFVTTNEFSVMATKLTSRSAVSWTHSLPFCFWPIFNLMKWPYYQKDVNCITLNQARICWFVVTQICFFEYTWLFG